MTKFTLKAAFAAAALVATASASAVPYTLTNAAGSFSNFAGFDWSSNGILVAPGFDPSAANSSSSATFFANAISVQDQNNTVIAGALTNAFEYTIVAQFNLSSSCVAGSCTLSTTGGSFNIWYDTTPDSTPGNGTGFNDGNLIASGSLYSGVAGSYIQLGSNGFGISVLNALMTYTDPAFITPALDYSNTAMTIQVNGYQTGGALTSTLPDGTTVASGSFQAQADANTAFVPEPASLLLVGGALAGLAGLRRRKAA